MSVRERLKFYLKSRNYKQSEFSSTLGLSNGYVNAIRNSISEDVIVNIKKHYPELNIEWLLRGDGQMIAMDGKSLDNFGESEGIIDGVTQIDHENYMEVEFRDLSVAAGPLSRTPNLSPKKTLLVPREYESGEYLVVRVDGPSMDDGSIYSIADGANILIRKYHLENGDRLPIRGNLFVIDSKDGQALKQITEHNIDEGYVTCHSYNPEFSDYKVPLEDVIAFYIYRKIVGYRPPVRDLN